MPRNQKPSLPMLLSEKEEAEFWENHSALDYDLKFSAKQLDVHPDARSLPITIRLPRHICPVIRKGLFLA